MALVLAAMLLPQAGGQVAAQSIASPPNPVARPLPVDGGLPRLSLEEVDPFAPEVILPDLSQPVVPPAATGASGFALVAPDPQAQPAPVRFAASLSDDGAELDRDLAWSIYSVGDVELNDDDLVLRSQGGTLETQLPPGSYVVHVSYGMASLSRPLNVGPNGLEERFTLGAGGMSLRAAIAAEDYLPADMVSFAVYPEGSDDNSNVEPLIGDVAEGTVLVLPAGRYTVVSRYGDVNALVRAQIDVAVGQLTEAVMFHQASLITLKLVNEPNGEALPGTAWSVLNIGGDIVREYVGAFPTMVLSQGDYTIIARHDGRVFNRNFSVVSGIDREVELVAQ